MPLFDDYGSLAALSAVTAGVMVMMLRMPHPVGAQSESALILLPDSQED